MFDQFWGLFGDFWGTPVQGPFLVSYLLPFGSPLGSIFAPFLERCGTLEPTLGAKADLMKTIKKKH